MLSVIERKVLGALILMSDVNGVVSNTSTKEIANRMGYKSQGGVISMALKMLEIDNRISITYGVKGRTLEKVLVHL